MDIEALLKRVPDSRTFMTLEEMEQSTDRLAGEYPDAVRVSVAGCSREGRPIRCLTIGSGPRHALIFGCPHPNEPIGAMMLETFSRLLAASPALRRELPYTFSLIKVADPDGFARNEGWLKGPYTLYNYASHFFRPSSPQQVEWTFPLAYRTLRFATPLPETRALMDIIRTTRPEYLFSLHNSAFGGAYWYMNRPEPALLAALPRAAARQDIPLSLGEPEMPCCKTYAKAIYEFPGLPLMYDYFAKTTGRDPAAMLTGGSCSLDYANAEGRTCFGIVCEMPYFLSRACMDESEGTGTRREAVLRGCEHMDAITAFMKPLVEKLLPHLPPEDPYAAALRERVASMGGQTAASRAFAASNPDFARTVTRAQAFDNLIALPYYTLLGVGMILRGADQAARTAAPADRAALNELAATADAYLRDECARIEEKAEFEPAAIRRLVCVQLETALLSLSLLGSPDGSAR